jgi:hypothetical protein
MTIQTELRRRRYDLHGVGVSVEADDDRVLAAIDLRLRESAIGQDQAEVEIELSFQTTEPDALTEPAPLLSRPVYDTPYGSLVYSPAADALCGELDGVRLRCHPAKGRAVMQCAGFEGRSLYVATHPLTTICLMELLERRGLFSLHAACLATGPEHGVLVAGPSGAGKSTLALALARSGLAFLGDDVIFLRRDGELVQALRFADAIGITEQTAAWFAETVIGPPAAPADGFPKRLWRIEQLSEGPQLGACVPRVIVFPRVVGEAPSWIAPLHSSEALLRLAPDVLLTEPQATQSHLTVFGELLDQVCCYEYGSGRDVEHAGELVRSMLAGAPGD